MLEIIGNTKHIDFLSDCFDVEFRDKPSGKHKFLMLEDNECHIDAVQLRRCLDEMTNEFAVKLPLLRFRRFRETGHVDYVKSTKNRLKRYEDIGLLDSELTHDTNNRYNIIFDPTHKSKDLVVKEFHCDFVLVYTEDF